MGGDGGDYDVFGAGKIFQFLYGGELYLGYVFSVVLQEMWAYADLFGYLLHRF